MSDNTGNESAGGRPKPTSPCGNGQPNFQPGYRMQDRRKHNRIGLRVPLGVYCDNEATRHACHTRDICIGGLFAEGLPCAHSTAAARIQMVLPDETELILSARVARATPQGAGMQFHGNEDTQLRKLEALLTPDWQGSDLLEGVVSIAPWYTAADLADWMRLTTIVSNWRRLTQR